VHLARSSGGKAGRACQGEFQPTATSLASLASVAAAEFGAVRRGSVPRRLCLTKWTLSDTLAAIDQQNNVRFLEPVPLPGPRRACVMILDEPAFAIPETILLREPALAEDYNRPEEDAA
jgi:hypothetical protein